MQTALQFRMSKLCQLHTYFLMLPATLRFARAQLQALLRLSGVAQGRAEATLRSHQLQ